MRAHSFLVLLVAFTGCRTTGKIWSIPAVAQETRRATPLGEVVGGEGRYGSHAWLGIPFAAPPVGALRWKAPRAPAPWTTPRESLAFGSACPQYATELATPDAKSGQIVGSEDCLTLNVWAPPFAADAVPKQGARLPVMVFIHGGGNSIGSAAFYDGGHLATAQKVVVVSTQYRLGPLGWFRHAALRSGVEDPGDQSGNFGTLDLVRALEWVRDDIAAFGGDPDNVTIFGESAGGTDVYSLLVSPRAKGLFHRAIIESGVRSSTTVDDAERFTDDEKPGHRNSSNEVLARALVEDGQVAGREAAKQRIATMGDAEIAKYLRGKSAGELLGLYGSNQRALSMLDLPLVIGDGAVLPKGDWLESLEKPDGWNRVPVMVGTNRDEMRLFLFLDPRRTWKLLCLFPRMRDEASYVATADALSRVWKANNVDAPAAAMLRSGATDVFGYRWDWRGEPTIWGSELSVMMGAAHGLELPFVFGHFEMGRLNMLFTEENRPGREELSQAMMAYWAQFARSGNPAVNGQAPWPAWSEAGKDAPRYLVLDVKSAGGLRMSSEIETIPRVLADVDAEPKLSKKDRCKVLRDLVAMLHAVSKDAYAQAKSCADYPLAQYPWDDKE